MTRHLVYAAALLALPAALPAAAQVGIVVVQPMPQSAPATTWVAGKASTDSCIDSARIAGAIVMDQRTLDLVMRGGKRWRLTLAVACPQLSYYGGFYYQPTRAGQICAGRDRIMGRAGGSCRVRFLAPLKQVAQKRAR